MRTHANLTIFSMSMAGMLVILLGGGFACKSITSLTISDAEAPSELSHLGHPGHERVPRLASPDCEV